MRWRKRRGRRLNVEQSGCIIIIDHRTSPAGRGLEAPQAADAGVESALCCTTLDELSRMQDVLFDQLRTGLPAVERIAGALECLDAEVAAWLRLHDDRGEAVRVVRPATVGRPWSCPPSDA